MKAHPLALRRPMLPQDDFDFGEPAAAPAPRAFLVGLREGFGPGGLCSLRMIMVVPGRSPAAAGAMARERIALEPARPGAFGRAITGELLRDARGRLFERGSDDGLRPLAHVVVSAQGQLYETVAPQDVEDVVPPDEPAAHEQVPQAPRRTPRRLRAPTTPPRERRVHEAAPEPTPEPAPQPVPRAGLAAATAPAPQVRALLPAPGKWVQVRVGEFGNVLHGQFAHPERLASDYEIGAWLQIFACDAVIDPAEAARQVFGDARAAARFAPWSAELGRRLGVTLGPCAGQGPAAKAAAGCIAAGQRFFALTVAADATADAADTASPSTGSGALQCSVPTRWQVAIPPGIAREQAMAQLQHAASPRWWQRWGQRVSAASRNSWRQQLAGRTLDEQLWSVPPPTHGLHDERVREWVTRTLRLAGYDAQRMADEWEVFWRCRGARD